MTIEQLRQINKPDGTFVQQIDKQVFIVDIFFNHDSKETLEDKFLRVILAEERKLHQNRRQ